MKKQHTTYWKTEAKKDELFAAINRIHHPELKRQLKSYQQVSDYPRIVDLATKHNKVKIACLAKEVIIAK